MWASLLKLLPVLGSIPFGPIFTFIGNVGKSMLKHPREWIIAGLLITNGGTYYMWQRTQDALVTEKAAHIQTIKTFKDAQEEANRKAKETKERLEKEAKANAEQADAHYATLLDKYHANLLRFKANQSASLGAGGGAYPATQGGNGPSGSPELSEEQIIISLADAKICAVNTARLEAVHDWAIKLPK
jgi:hypothetical protein